MFKKEKIQEPRIDFYGNNHGKLPLPAECIGSTEKCCSYAEGRRSEADDGIGFLSGICPKYLWDSD